MKKLLFIFILLPLQLFAQYTWQVLPNAPKSWRCDDIYFLTPQMGWAIHAYYDYSSLSTFQYGQVYKTIDGGDTWQLMHSGVTTYYRCVGFVDSLHGWIGNLNVTSDTIPLYYTNNGGKTVTPVTLPSPQPKGICGISVVTDSVVYAYGRYFSNPVIVKTIDQGKTWTSTDMSPYASVGLIDGWFWSKDTGFITGQDGANAVILHTNDGGTTWQTVYHASRNDSDHPWKLSFPTRDIGYGALECLKSTVSNRYFVKTIDGGNTWTEYPFISNYDEEGIGFINDSVGWLGGDYNQPNYKTIDGGNTWNVDSGFGVITPPFDSLYYFMTGTATTPFYGSSINRFRKFGDTLMYASGNTVYKLNANTTGIPQFQRAILQATVYPNPFVEQTTISYTLPLTCNNVNIEVYNVLGIKIFTQKIETQNPGKHNVIFNQPIPAGVYLYVITADNYTMSGKLVKEK